MFGVGVLSTFAQTQSESPHLFGSSKFMLTGNAEAKFIADSGSVNFGDVSFKPIFL